MNKNAVLFLIVMAILALILFTVPVDSDYRTLYITAVIHKPLVGSAEIQDVIIEESPSTILTSPLYLGSILYSAPLKIIASTESASKTQPIFEIIRSTTNEVTIVLPRVPVADHSLTLELYEGGEFVSKIQQEV